MSDLRIDEHYRNLSDEQIERLAWFEAGDLRPEAIPILRTEVSRRGLAGVLHEAIDIHVNGLSQEEQAAVIQWFRSTPCPICGGQGRPLNACNIDTVRGFVVVSERQSELVVACPSCLERLVEEAGETTQTLGCLGGPLSWIPSALAVNRNDRAFRKSQQQEPTAAFLMYVSVNMAVLAVKYRETIRRGV